MANYLNRLNKTDAELWDKAFKQFCKTGVWNMEQANFDNIGIDGEPINIIEPKVNNFMADPGHAGRFPGSRDWDYEGLQIKCDLIRCVANHGGICLTPTRIKIGTKGCKAYQKRKK